MGIESTGLNATENTGNQSTEFFFDDDDLFLDDIESPFDDIESPLDDIESPLDDIEPPKDKQPDSNVVLFKINEDVDKADSLLDSIHNFGLDELVEDSAFVSADEEEELQELQELITSLKDKGYVGIEELDYEELITLLQREENLTKLETDDDLMANSMLVLLDGIREEFLSSKASLYKTDITRVDTQIKNLQRSPFISDVVASNLYKLANSFTFNSTDNISDSVQKIINAAVQLGMIDDKFLTQYGKEVEQYVGSLIPAVLSSKTQQKHQLNTIHGQRKFTADVLLKDVEEVRKVYATGNIRYVRQLYQVGPKLYCECPACHAMQEFPKHTISVILFPSEISHSFVHESSKLRLAGNFFIYTVLHPLQCSCGQSIAFGFEDYDKIKGFVLRYIKGHVKETVAAIENFGRGTSLLTLRLPQSALTEALGDIIVSNSDKGLETPTVEENISDTVNSRDNIQTLGISDDDFKKAVKAFYTYLEGFTQDENNRADSEYSMQNRPESSLSVAEEQEPYLVTAGRDHISYKDMAVYISASLSKKYEKVKNQAIFTLLAAIEESAALSLLCNKEELWFWENQMSLLDSINKQTKLIKPEFLQSLYDSYNSLRPNEVDMDDFYKNTEVRNEVLNYLLDNKQLILDRISHLKQCHSVALQSINDNLELLGYTKIMNINQYNFKSFSYIVDSPELLEALDHISDRMIVFNYSPEFYQLYMKRSIVNKSPTFSKQLSLNNADKLKSSTFFKNLFGTISSMSEEFNEDDKARVQRFFEYILEMSALPLEELHRMKKAFSSYKFYDFLEIALNLRVSTLLVSEQADDMLARFKKDVKVFADDIEFDKCCNSENGREMFYFRDFSEEEINSCRDFASLPVKRFILKRNPGETPTDYCKRYKSLVKENGFNSLNARDQLELFAPLVNYFVFILNGANVYELDYPCFSECIFCNALIKTCVQVLSKKGASKLLGIPSSYLNLLNKNITTIDVDSLNPDLMEFNNKMLMANYSDNLMPYIKKENQIYESITMLSDNCISDSFNSYDFLKVIGDILNNVASLKNEDADDILDEEDVRNELYLYASYCNGFVDRY